MLLRCSNVEQSPLQSARSKYSLWCSFHPLRFPGYLLPAFLPDKLPEPLRWLVEPNGPLASKVGDVAPGKPWEYS